MVVNVQFIGASSLKGIKRLTGTELDPVMFGYRTVQDILEYMAECGECEMLVLDKGVYATIRMNVHNKDTDMDLTMLDLPWTETGILPVGAVEDQYLAQQVFDVYEGVSIAV